MKKQNKELRAENKRLKSILWTPETKDFLKGVELEIPHQRDRWGEGHDEEKTDTDWFWTFVLLGQKAVIAVTNGDIDKAKHHCISSTALMGNYHRILTNREK